MMCSCFFLEDSSPLLQQPTKPMAPKLNLRRTISGLTSTIHGRHGWVFMFFLPEVLTSSTTTYKAHVVKVEFGTNCFRVKLGDSWLMGQMAGDTFGSNLAVSSWQVCCTRTPRRMAAHSETNASLCIAAALCGHEIHTY
jgi:hypothetical protein